MTKLLNSLLVHLRNWTVIAGKDDCQYLRRAVVLETMRLPVDAGKAEVWSVRPDRQHWIAVYRWGRVVPGSVLLLCQDKRAHKQSEA